MSRLADYFVVVGYSLEKDSNGIGCGNILQRFPEKDWDDCPFISGLPLFCQPMGWALSHQQDEPSFYVAILTDMDGERHYCAVLTFSEIVAMTSSKPGDEEDDCERHTVHHSTVFAPKSLVLVSRHDYFDIFKNCLGTIYTVYLDNLSVKLETLVGNILGCVYVPSAGGPQVRFSISGGDRQVIQPPMSATLPISNTSVAILFKQLGINNTLTIFSAALTDHKILFYSGSCSRLCDASRALAALHYPLKYTYVFIPVLPASLLEVLNSPTPFIAGVHASLKDDIVDFLDVIVVDLDGGSVHIPECVTVPSITEHILARAKQALTMILNPDLLYADYAFSPVARNPSPLVHMDKELRAVFIRMFAELFSGYRSSLAVVRIHPLPFITFHKSHFLGHRDMVDDTFLSRLLDGMAFNTFVAERGPPYRVCDIFDEVSATIQDQLHEEHQDSERVIENIRELAHNLYANEIPNQQPFVPIVPKPTEGAHIEKHHPQFPTLDGKLVQDMIDEGLHSNSLKRLCSLRPPQMQIVPASGLEDLQRTLENKARRLEVLKSCVNFIFDNKISEARKIFPAVLRALKSAEARLALTFELEEHVLNNKAVLESQQFDMVVKLLNCALMNDSSLDENGVAAAILPLATAFCRKLCQGVIQFAYTLIQEHAVWGNLQFWEQSFYQDVQLQVQQLYLPMYEEYIVLMSKSTDSTEDFLQNNKGDARSSTLRPRKIGPLEITAEQLRIWPAMTSKQQQEMVSNEESVVYSQAIHYAYRMVYMRVPLDVSRTFRNISLEENSSIVTTSVAESDSLDAESGFYENEQTDVAAAVTKFVARFVDKVCSDGSVSQEHLRSLQQTIPGMVAMHFETLEDVNRESKRLPPVQKPKIQQPTLLPGEEIVMEGLRAYLLADGRDVVTRGNIGGPSLLPAEGAVFLTTYRIIFRGMPCDPFVCEQTIMRGFPVASLTREKKISVQHYLSQVEHRFQEGLQLRSALFQLMKIAFDEEVSSDSIETFRKHVNKVRSSSSLYTALSFTGHTVHSSTQMIKKGKENISLRQFAKQKLLKTARKAGLKKHSKSKPKYSVNSPPSSLHGDGNSSPHSSDSESEHSGTVHYSDLSVIDENDQTPSHASDPKNIERLMDRHAYQDYQRLGLGSVTLTGQQGRHSEPFRISTINAHYLLCRSYPGLLVVPQSVSDESIRKFSKCNRQSRFPVITWWHPKTRALLLRASGFHSRSLMGMFRHNTTASTSSSYDSSSAVEQEKYFSLLVAATLSSSQSNYLRSLNSDCFTSLAALLKFGTTRDAVNIRSATEPRLSVSQGSSVNKSSPVPSAVSNINNDSSVNITGSLQERSPNTGQRQQAFRESVNEELINNSINQLNHVALYVFGEKSQVKGIKAESFPKCDFIPVDFHEVRQVKASFKKLLRACLPSSPAMGPDQNFLKAVEDSEWLLQLSSIIQLSGAVVDLMDAQGSSVMICLEDGWDITTQIVAVSQVMMDPYYRTFEGFKTLIEKEWLGFGHRFSHRNNQTSATQNSGFVPIFLQFLDIVHQIHHQFPLSFEFNQYFLCYVAYHSVSNRFSTFMLDSELERVESGWLLEEQGINLTSGFKNSDHVHLSHVSSLLEHGQHNFSDTKHNLCGASLWEHLDILCKQSPVFFNFAYDMEDQDPILRPMSNISNLKIWDFFVTEDLSQGILYDLDLEESGTFLREEPETDIQCVNGRKTLNASYHSIFLQQPDYFWSKIQEISRLQADLGMKPSPWRAIFDRLECLGRQQFHGHDSPNTQLVRLHSHSIHTKSTLEILVRGKVLGGVAHLLSQPHRFEKHTYTTSTFCDYCSQMLWGLSKTGLRCADCGYNCHDKCQSRVPKNCQKLKALGDIGLSAAQIQDSGSPASNVSPDTAPSSHFDHFKEKISEQGTHEGYLFKQGQLFRQWKQRWFVLDPMKHQLRYYETHDDQNCKGFIDLSEVESVSQVKSVHGALKKAGDNCFIEIRAVRRVYNFVAADSKSAVEWVDKLQGCLQRE